MVVQASLIRNQWMSPSPWKKMAYTTSLSEENLSRKSASHGFVSSTLMYCAFASNSVI